MTDRQARLARLAEVSRLLLETRLAETKARAAAMSETRRRIADLAAMPDKSGAFSPIVDAIAAYRYQLWAEAKRSELNAQLARQTADWLDSCENARLALGRAEVLRRLREG